MVGCYTVASTVQRAVTAATPAPDGKGCNSIPPESGVGPREAATSESVNGQPITKGGIMKPKYIFDEILKDGDDLDTHWYAVVPGDDEAHLIDMEWIGGKEPVRTFCGIDVLGMPVNISRAWPAIRAGQGPYFPDFQRCQDCEGMYENSQLHKKLCP